MNYEKILTRPDKSKVKITVSITTRYGGLVFNWGIDVETKQPRKRNWIPVIDAYLKWCSIDARDAFILSKQLEYVTKDEIKQAKLEFLETLKKQVEDEA
ncbi:MAG: hypothetical protein KDC44_14795 [Phaeodactylibacter sp.]|nr:hypothetical protein [Candidatus Kaiserbacteria bacterium]MCB0642913.1 hypothetical protein [Phaeodactylibacter sp.]